MKLTIEAVARICHQANKAYCEAIGDKSQVDWERAPHWQQESAISGVRLHLDNPKAGPEASHNAWLELKRLAGWTFGPEKDETYKRHPCMLPYDQLPPAQQAKDALFCGIVASLRHRVVRELPLQCGCGHRFPESLGAYGCPNCEGDEGPAIGGEA